MAAEDDYVPGLVDGRGGINPDEYALALAPVPTCV